MGERACQHFFNYPLPPIFVTSGFGCQSCFKTLQLPTIILKFLARAFRATRTLCVIVWKFMSSNLLSCKSIRFFRPALVSSSTRRGDDRKYVCCSQATNLSTVSANLALDRSKCCRFYVICIEFLPLSRRRSSARNVRRRAKRNGCFRRLVEASQLKCHLDYDQFTAVTIYFTLGLAQVLFITFQIIVLWRYQNYYRAIVRDF